MKGTISTSYVHSLSFPKLDKYKLSLSPNGVIEMHAKTNSGNTLGSLKGHINSILLGNSKYFCSKIPVPLMVFFFCRKDGKLIRFYCNHTAILASWEIHTNNTKLLQAYGSGFQWFNHEAQCPATLVVCSFACVWWRQQWVQVGTPFKCGSCGTCLWFTEKERSFLLLVGGAVSLSCPFKSASFS